jgi:hypothetical protein
MRNLVRAGSGMTLALLVIYFALRETAAQCAGPACEGYILPSLLIPLLILVAALITGLVAVVALRKRLQEADSPEAKRWYSLWLGLLIVGTLLGVVGPIASAVILRDQPNAFVVSSTVLLCVTLVCALLSSLVAVR